MVKNRRTNVKHLPRCHDESWLQRSLPKRWLTASLAVDPSDPPMIMTMTMTKRMRQGQHYCNSPPLSLSLSLSEICVDLQCKTTEMPRLKSLTKEINLGKLSSFCSSPVSGELHALLNVSWRQKTMPSLGLSVDPIPSDPMRSDPIRKCVHKNALSNIFFSSRFCFFSSIFNHRFFTVCNFVGVVFFFLFHCPRETVTMKKDFWSVVFVAMAYLKLWPTWIRGLGFGFGGDEAHLKPLRN